MKEQRARALARTLVKRSEAELKWLVAVLEAGRENLSPKNLEITEKHIEHQTEVIERAHERLQKYMSRFYCRWQTVGSVYDGKYRWTFRYTLDKDGDGYYWYKITKDEALGTLLGIRHSKQLRIKEGKRRKKKDVKTFAEKKYKERIAQIREAKAAKAAGKEVT